MDIKAHLKFIESCQAVGQIANLSAEHTLSLHAYLEIEGLDIMELNISELLVVNKKFSAVFADAHNVEGAETNLLLPTNKQVH